MPFAYPLTGLAAIFTLTVYFWMIIKVGQARAKHDIKAPETQGPDEFMRVMRVHANTVEGLVLFMPLLWIFAILWGDMWAGIVGVIYPVGRIVYALGYYKDAEKRSTGFMIGFISTVLLLLGCVVGLVMAAIA